MHGPDQYLAIVVGLMFVAGIVISIYSNLQRSRLRRRGDSSELKASVPQPLKNTGE